jgi:hypothetical protein
MSSFKCWHEKEGFEANNGCVPWQPLAASIFLIAAYYSENVLAAK